MPVSLNLSEVTISEKIYVCIYVFFLVVCGNNACLSWTGDKTVLSEFDTPEVMVQAYEKCDGGQPERHYLGKNGQHLQSCFTLSKHLLIV